MISSYLVREGALKRQVSRAEVEDFLKSPRGVLWVDIESPTEAELRLLAEGFNFHPLAVEDASKESDLPKADLYEGYAHIVVHRAARDLELIEHAPGEMDFFLSRTYLVTAHMEPSMSAAEVARRIEAHPAVLEAGPDRIMYEIIDRIVDGHTKLLDRYEDAIDEIEVEILSGKTHDRLLERALKLRRDLADLRKGLGPQRELLQRLARRDVPYVTEAISPYMRDVVDHMNRVYQSLETHRDHLSSLFEAYMAFSSQGLSLVMKRLTLIATIFMPLSFVAGVYGMNFEVMPGLGHPYGFLGIVTIMGIMGGSMLWYFRRRGMW